LLAGISKIDYKKYRWAEKHGRSGKYAIQRPNPNNGIFA
jgi:hypothetical protein